MEQLNAVLIVFVAIISIDYTAFAFNERREKIFGTFWWILAVIAACHLTYTYLPL